MNSNVGNPQVYESGDQRNTSREDDKQRYNEGTKNAHKATDSKDQRTIHNRLAAESSNKSQGSDTSGESKDPRAVALAHGNEPSRGAKIDAELQAEDEAIIAKKDGKTD